VSGLSPLATREWALQLFCAGHAGTAAEWAMDATTSTLSPGPMTTLLANVERRSGTLRRRFLGTLIDMDPRSDDVARNRARGRGPYVKLLAGPRR
jgi:hypothetical protein